MAAILRKASAGERRALSHLRNFDFDFLERWQIAPAELRKPSFLSVFKDKAEIEELLAALKVLNMAGLDQVELLSRISNITSRKKLSVAFRALMSGLKFTDHPLPGNTTIVAVTSVAELCAAARALRNCSASYMFDVLDGRSAFYVMCPDDPVGMVHLEREDGRWVIGDIVGISNRPVTRKLADGVFEYFEHNGVCRTVRCRPSQWDAVRRFCQTPYERHR
ncbi:hypothetical protein [Alteripontixanthobacter maritimus]|uniref:hypothetical protein n=1 Tax=Alteripontixanthobacter maritimus TaxID=2161824 RepID=UPI0011C07056|nr:hypothetical protein [Alteripontixanthobacter maritimus]